MANNAAALRSQPHATTRKDVSQKVEALARSAPYQKPEVVSFPIDGLKMSQPLTMAGNTGAPVLL